MVAMDILVAEPVEMSKTAKIATPILALVAALWLSWASIHKTSGAETRGGRFKGDPACFQEGITAGLSGNPGALSDRCRKNIEESRR